MLLTLACCRCCTMREHIASKVDNLSKHGASVSQTACMVLLQAKRTQHPIMLAIPAAFDIVATVLMNTGLLSVTASVYQMMRGAEMIFAALLAVTLLQRTLNRLHYGGLAACVGGIAIVGLASVLSGTGGSKVRSAVHVCGSYAS
jgi:drug/metabolite transporter (DMT)-like permease